MHAKSGLRVLLDWKVIKIISDFIAYEVQPGVAIPEIGHAGASDVETLKIADKLLKLIGENRLNLKPTRTDK